MINIILVNVIILFGDNGLFRNLVLVMLFLIYFWENYLLETFMPELGLCCFSLEKLMRLLLEVSTLLTKMNGKIKLSETMEYIKQWNIIQHHLLTANSLSKLYGNLTNLDIWDITQEDIPILHLFQLLILNQKLFNG